MTNSECLIVGGGIIGLSLAWRLRQKGASVTIVDAGATAPPATLAAAGMLAPSFEKGAGPLEQSLYALGVESLRQWASFAEALEDASGGTIDYQPTGMLGVALTQEQVDRLSADYRRLLAEGARVQWLSSDEARAMEPALAPDICAALFAMDDAQVDPPRVLQALALAFDRAQGRLLRHTRVARLVVEGDQVRGVALEDGAILSAERVILASGVSTPGLMPAPPPVFPVKGEATALHDRARTLTRAVRAPGAYLCPKSDGRLVIGATEAPHDSSRTVRGAEIEALKRRAARIAPVISELSEESRWSGLRPGTLDGAPILGVDPNGPKGLTYALGHYRNGVLLAPATADLLAESLTTGVEAPLLAPFSPARFHG